MGGHLAGEVASQMAIDAVRRMAARHKKPSVDLLKKTVLRARTNGLSACAGTRRMRGHGHDDLHDVARRRIYVYCARRRQPHLSPSRRAHGADHTGSFAGWQSWFARVFDPGGSQAASAPQHHHRALGTEGDNTPDLLAADIRPGDCFLLCTDGLTGMVRDDDIERTLLDSKPIASGGQPSGRGWRLTRAAATM